MELADLRRAVEAGLDALLPPAHERPRRLHAAMRYAVLEGGGKRLRPLLMLAAAHAVGGAWEPLVPAAAGVECIHAYSLVHDDLPALDDDDLRRGRPSLHRAFDEATALLAGDALLPLGFGSLAQVAVVPERCRLALAILAAATGSTALVGGQAEDLMAEGQPPSLERVEWIHARKTSALIEAALEMGAVLVGAEARQRAALRRFGRAYGLAFQILDDLLDLTGGAGKEAGGDDARGKQTYPAVLGREGAVAAGRAAIDEARAALVELGGDTRLLEALVREGPLRSDLF